MSWKPFVQNRVNEIKKLVSADQWYHCPGRDNPVDLPSRGIPLSELIDNHLWFEGPTWLLTRDPVELSLEEEEIPQECLQESKSRSECISMLVVAEGRKPLIKLEDYSDLNRLLRVSAYALLFIQRARKQEAELVNLIAKEEEWWAKEAQCSLRSGEKFEILKRQLDLFQDSYGLWRCRGRIHKANLPYSTRFPIVLPNHHYFTRLVIHRAHETVFHNGVKETLTEVRSQYWITKGRSVIKRIVRECVICRRLEAVAYRAPPAPPPPDFRIMKAPAFTFVGVDFAGPLYIKRPKSGATEESNKVWICLYTCCVTRGVHLDLVTDLSTVSFLRCFKRFVARRGIPVKVVSDNGKTFKAASKILSDEVVSEVCTHLAPMRVKWLFNVERAPWWGGVFERMVKSMKRCLRKVVGRASLSYEELLTVVTEVEMIINCRPLSFISQEDTEEAT